MCKHYRAFLHIARISRPTCIAGELGWIDSDDNPVGTYAMTTVVQMAIKLLEDARIRH